MLKIEFKNENFRWLFQLKDGDGTIKTIEDVVMLKVLFYGQFEKDVWLRFAWPTIPEHIAITKLDDNSAFALEVTPEMASIAPEGVIIIQATYKITDSRYDSGFKQITEKGKVLRMVNVRS